MSENQNEGRYIEIGKRLDEFRRSLDIDRKTFSEAMDFTVSHYSNLSNGIKLISNRHMVKLITLYPDCNLTYILGGHGNLRLSDSGDKYDKEIMKLEAQINVLKEVLGDKWKGDKVNE